MSKINDSMNSQNGLSSKELKEKLIQVVKNKGIFDSMKSQLRNKLVLELNPNSELVVRNKTTDMTINQNLKSNLALNTINSLVINHLKASEYDYTLSVFMPECGIGLNDAYSLTDVLHILKVSPESKLYEELVRNLNWN
jgi:oral-facial-digital syndrome 1 protein